MLRSINFLLAVVFVAAAALNCHAQTPSNGLTIQWDGRYLDVFGDAIPGDFVRTHYLEAYCRPGSTDRDWHETVIKHTSELKSASKDKKRIEIQDRLADGVIVNHVIVAGTDDVTFTLTATNPTDVASEAHWAQPCMRVDRFTGADPAQAREVYPPYIKKCFLMVDDRLTRLPTSPWALQARYVPGQVYAPKHVPRDDVNPRPLSDVVPSSGLTGCYSADEKMMLAMAWQPYQEIFQGVITCMHNDFRIGGLEPGQTKQIRGKLYVVPADPDKLIRRFKTDFPD
ncbi:MAG: hypothetical protein KDB00_06505 [Planctomycetales bacterium]|nr:hypothetical protein [Planctomycetales bacterium]